MLCITALCFAHGRAQDVLVSSYLQVAGDYANLYSGNIETGYNVAKFDNTPYYMNADYTEATIVYRNNHYYNQDVRLDLYQDQLIVFSPEKRYGIIVNPLFVNKVYLNERTFVWLNPTKESGLKAGYYMQMFEGEKLQLFSKENCTLQDGVRNRMVIYSFSRSTRYYLFYNNRYYSMKNKGSFTKLFPQHKRRIDQFVKDNKLNFNRDPELSLTSLAIHCEELINSTTTQ
jgi:hypothetical protein